MSSRSDLIAQAIFKKPFANCSLSEMEDLAQAYPYFAPVHFLIAKKLQQSGVANAQVYLQKAALYYHQPAAFEAFLYNDEITLTEPVAQPETIAPAETAEPEEQELESTATEESFAPTPETPQEETPAIETDEAAIIEEMVTEPAVVKTASITLSDGDTDIPTSDQIEEPKPDPQPQPQTPHEPLAFEPFHTVDYFASQGIRLTQEELPKDKFGKQLKSFTEWLKTMKKLPASEQVKTIDPQAEQKVEHLAAHSVEGSDVVTETMAEVWIKQGARDKAAQVYHKLSLLNPSKRAYFAAKIENLK